MLGRQTGIPIRDTKLVDILSTLSSLSRSGIYINTFLATGPPFLGNPVKTFGLLPENVESDFISILDSVPLAPFLVEQLLELAKKIIFFMNKLVQGFSKTIESR